MWTSVGRRSGAIIIRRGGVALRRHGIWMRRVVGIMVHRSQGLSMCTVDGRLTLLRIDGATSTLWRHGAWLTQVRVGGMGRDEGLCLRGNGCEYTFLLEALTVGATTILGRIKAGTTNLAQRQRLWSSSSLAKSSFYLATTAIPACDGRSLPGSWLARIGHMRRRRRMMRILSVHVVRRWVHVRRLPRMRRRRQGDHLAWSRRIAGIALRRRLIEVRGQHHLFISRNSAGSMWCFQGKRGRWAQNIWRVVHGLCTCFGHV